MNKNQSPPPLPLRQRSRLPGVTIAVLVGAVVGGWLSYSLAGALLGALLGFLAGWRIAEIRSSYGSPDGVAKHFPSARLCFVLAAGSWAAGLLLWGWVLTRSPGTFHDQGGMFITFIVFPFTAFCWLIGGPTASVAGRHAMKQLQAGTRPESDRWMARAGIALSRLMSLTILGLVLWLAVEMSR